MIEWRKLQPVKSFAVIITEDLIEMDCC